MIFNVNWGMNCVPFGGNGGCTGSIKVVPPAGHNAKVAISQERTAACNNPRECPPHFTTPKPGATIKCPGHCGRVNAGVARVRIVGDDTLDAADLANSDLVFVLELACANQKVPTLERIVLHFGPFGRLQPGKSQFGS